LLEFVDILEKALNLLTTPVDIFFELSVHFFPAVDLRLQVLDCPVNVA
jgi:hypothetical protein